MEIEKSEMVVVDGADYVQIYINGDTYHIHGNDELARHDDVRVEIHHRDDIEDD